MGQKINPVGFRLGTSATWGSRWFAPSGKYGQFLVEDNKTRDLLMKKLRPAGITKVEIERSIGRLKILVFVSRPGVLIGRGGSGLQDLKKYLMKELKIKDENKLEVAPMDIKNPDLSAYLVAQSIAEQLSRRMPAARVMNQALDRIMRSGAKGAKVVLAGRIGGPRLPEKRVNSRVQFPFIH